MKHIFYYTMALAAAMAVGCVDDTTLDLDPRVSVTLTRVYDPVDENPAVVEDANGVTYEIDEMQGAQLAASSDSGTGVVWSSSNEQILEVDQQGYVTDVGYGVATITASAEGCEVPPYCIFDVDAMYWTTIAQEEIQITLSDSFYLTEETSFDTEDPEIEYEWRSLNEDVATVGQDGCVKATGVGECKIVVTRGGVQSLPCIVSVNPITADINYAEAYISIEQGADILTLVATHNRTPLEVDDEPVIEWFAEDPTFVSVTDGVLTPLAIGSTNVYATVDGVTTQMCVVNVLDSIVDSITLDVTEDDVEWYKGVDPTYNIGYTLMPTAAAITFSSSDESVATVDSDGVVRALTEGDVTITMKHSLDETVEETIELSVVKKVSIPYESFQYSDGALLDDTIDLSWSNVWVITGDMTTVNNFYGLKLHVQSNTYTRGQLYLEFPDQTTVIPSSALAYTENVTNISIASLSFPRVTSLGTKAINYLVGLKHIHLPALTSIAWAVFTGVWDLESIEVSTNPGVTLATLPANVYNSTLSAPLASTFGIAESGIYYWEKEASQITLIVGSLSSTSNSKYTVNTDTAPYYWCYNSFATYLYAKEIIIVDNAL
ncbi:MAG: Ig-like domain-containing protein [Rikenellaceae bacterium]